MSKATLSFIFCKIFAQPLCIFAIEHIFFTFVIFSRLNSLLRDLNLSCSSLSRSTFVFSRFTYRFFSIQSFSLSLSLSLFVSPSLSLSFSLSLSLSLCVFFSSSVFFKYNLYPCSFASLSLSPLVFFCFQVTTLSHFKIHLSLSLSLSLSLVFNGQCQEKHGCKN